MFSEKQRDALAKIDISVNSLTDIVADFMRVGTNGVAEFPFILEVIQRLGLYDTIYEFLAKYLTYSLPALEITAKTALLAELRKINPCSEGVFIPSYLRKYDTTSLYPTSRGYGQYGIRVNIPTIDTMGILNYSPLSQEGYILYFGNYDSVQRKVRKVFTDMSFSERQRYLSGETIYYDDRVVNEEIPKNVYSFARADDFDAFIWFVMHKASFTSPSVINTENGLLDGLRNEYGQDLEIYDYSTRSANVKSMKQPFVISGDSKVIQGNTMVEERDGSGGGTMSLVFSENEKDGTTSTVVVPVSSDWRSCNWYVDKKNYLDRNIIGEFSDEKRNYSNEVGILNLEYIRDISYDPQLSNVQNRELLMTILPKPFFKWHINGEKSKMVKFMFDSENKPNNNGKYSIPYDMIDEKPIRTVEDGRYEFYAMKGSTEEVFYYVTDSGQYGIIEGKEHLLTECYPGLTVVEFIYDLVMGMRLFDSKALAARILNMTLAPTMSVTREEREPSVRMRQIINRILFMNDEEIDDCFYSFSNQEYGAMMKETENDYLNQFSLNNPIYSSTTVTNEQIKELFANYDNSAQLNVQKDNLQRIIEKAGDIVGTDFDLRSEKLQIKFNFITLILSNLITAIIEALLTPKIRFIFEINKAIVGNSSFNASSINTEGVKNEIDSFYSEISNILGNYIKTIKQDILNKLKERIFPELIKIFEQYNIRVNAERTLRQLLIRRTLLEKCALNIKSLFGKRPLLNTYLDQVDYADIDENELSKIKKGC